MITSPTGSHALCRDSRRSERTPDHTHSRLGPRQHHLGICGRGSRLAFHVITWDLPGLGRSKGKIDLESFAADLRAVTELAGGTKGCPRRPQYRRHDDPDLVRDDPAFVDAYVAGIVLLNTTHTNPLRTMILSPLWQALRWPLIEPLMWLAIPLQPLVWLSAWQSYLSGSAHLANRFGFGKHVSRSQLNATALLGTRNSPGAQARGNLAMFRWDATGALSKVCVSRCSSSAAPWTS